MDKIQFRCKLLTDIIISEQSASERQHKTLDFIPGSVFLGIVASSLYKEMNDYTFDLFHSSRVRFGDAHPVIDGNRCYRIPSSWYYKKKAQLSEGIYQVEESKDLKQCRDGFFYKKGNQYSIYTVPTQFVLKSAYDSQRRKSENEKMFCFESIQEGVEMCFEVCFNDLNLCQRYRDDIKNALCGKKRIGRSSSAQFGLVEISSEGFNTIESTPSQGSISLYLESRLICIDSKTGLPTLRPTPSLLSSSWTQGEIDWARSSVRTFAYAPYNRKRNNYDSDRIGFEKGSILCLKNISIEKEAFHLGAYCNEGFGSVLVNPAFLTLAGGCELNIEETKINRSHLLNDLPLSEVDKNLIAFLNQKNKKEINKIYKLVDEAIKTKEFEQKDFLEVSSSQWGSIRNMATARLLEFNNKEEFFKDLFEKESGYLVHGIRKGEWEDNNRKEHLKALFQSKDWTLEAIIHLTALMSKKSKKQ